MYQLDEVITALKEVVREKGRDYVYVDPQGVVAGNNVSIDCVYATPDGSPSCIVGWVVNRLDSEAYAKLVERQNYDGTFGWASFGESTELFSPEANAALLGAQERQDMGIPYGQVLLEVKAPDVDHWREAFAIENAYVEYDRNEEDRVFDYEV